MSSLKMYNFSPKPQGKTLPEGFTVTKYKGEEDIDAWVEICSDGLVSRDTARQRFIHELTEIDGPDPYRDTYFIEKDGEKIATYTVVPNMWSTGMGYIHMVACKSEYRASVSAASWQMIPLRNLLRWAGIRFSFLQGMVVLRLSVHILRQVSSRSTISIMMMEKIW